MSEAPNNRYAWNLSQFGHRFTVMTCVGDRFESHCRPMYQIAAITLKFALGSSGV